MCDMLKSLSINELKKIKCVSFISSIGLCIVDQVQRYARHAFAVITQYIVEKYIVEIEVK